MYNALADDYQKLKFIPVRGRKHISRFEYVISFVEIYPREGTETIIRFTKDKLVKVEIYPREGTETVCLPALDMGYMLKFIPVRGRKPASQLEVRWKGVR